tara:strand:+ start:1123 stop:1971 length:849 start_codon:yes stop_codon:yes gene_type:complete
MALGGGTLGGGSSLPTIGGPGIGVLPVLPPGRNPGYTAWDRNTSYGASDLFGDKDYKAALQQAYGQRGSAADVQSRRNEILSWLDADQSRLGEGNRRGVEGGLYDRMMSTNLGTGMMNKDFYGHADWLHGMAIGHDDQTQAAYARANQGQFRDNNAPGVFSGLYETIQRRGGEAQSRTSTLDNIQQNLKNYGDKFSAQQALRDKTLSDEMRAFQKDQADYERKQSDWRQRQTALTEQTHLNQIRAMKEKPVMQIMPSGGGGGMSAGSLSGKGRKKITGLNIK